jgi:hypothetical protein
MKFMYWQACFSEEKLSIPFPIGSYAKTMSCDSGHLGFPINNKKTQFL